MHILTLTTDLGTRDHYLASLRALLLKLMPEVHTVDVSHHIPPFDIAKGAFVLKNVWSDFPEGTIHLIAVDSQWSKNSPYVLVVYRGHFFLGTDNGTFSLLFDGADAEAVYSIKMEGTEDLTFPARSILIPAAAKLLQGIPPQQFAEKSEGYRKRPSLHPVVERDVIRGTIIYVDAYGNLITNITRALFDEVVGQRPFHIALRRGDHDLRSISRTYAEVPEGEKVALFSSGGYLEIAINRGVEGSGGGASGLLGLRENDIIRIELLD